MKEVEKNEIKRLSDRLDLIRPSDGRSLAPVDSAEKRTPSLRKRPRSWKRRSSRLR